MYLSRLILNPRCRAVQNDLADCQAMHRTVMSLFGQVGGEGARAALGVLHRLEIDNHGGRLRLLVQSAERPDFTHLPANYLAATTEPNPECKPLDEAYRSLRAGRTLRFRLLANPTRKIDTKSSPEGKRNNGQRVPLRHEKDQLAWLARKAEASGFRLRQVAASPPGEGTAQVPAVRASPAGRLGQPPRRTSPGSRITVEAVLFEGLLEVTDAEALRAALAVGIGPGKAYGCGLLSVAPA